MSHNCPHILDWRTTSLSVLEGVSFVCQKAENHACRHLEMIGECVDLVFHFRVVIEGVTVKVAELRDVLFQGRVSK